MRPTDPADAHLKDRAYEIRLAKGAIVVFLVSLLSLIYPWAAIFALFVLGYIAYKYRYYTNRVGVYEADLSGRHDRLEYGLLGFVGAVVVVYLGIGLLFPADWELGGILSLPAIELSSAEAIRENAVPIVAWVFAFAPLGALTYVIVQFRKRLLIGIDTEITAVRATIWDALAALPVVVVWIAVFTTRPIFDVWAFVANELAAELDIVLSDMGAFSVLFGGDFSTVLIVGIVTPVVVGAFLSFQHWKYLDSTVPEVLGYRGLLAPTRDPHKLNIAVPVAVYLLFALGVRAIEPLAITDTPVVLGAVVAAILGANVFGTTTRVLDDVSEDVLDYVDQVIVGIGAGIPFLLVVAILVGAGSAIGTLAASFLLLAIPLTSGANWLVERWTRQEIEGVGEQILADPDALEEDRADQLFRYSRGRDDALRATAVFELAGIVRATGYRRDDGLAVIADAVGSDVDEVARAGLRAVATMLISDRPNETHAPLIEADVHEAISAHLESDDELTRLIAAESLARLSEFDLSTGADRKEWGDSPHVRTLADLAADHPDRTGLIDAVVEYFARLWLWQASHDAAETAEGRTFLLERLLFLTDQASETPRGKVASAVGSKPATVDATGITLAHERLGSEHPETRVMAAHAIRSSAERHRDLIEPTRLLALLEDDSAEVRRISADAIAKIVAESPEHADELQDQLMYHLEDHVEAATLAEGPVLSALGHADVGDLIDHPTAVPTIAAYVEDRRAPIAEPAAALLGTIVATSTEVVDDSAVVKALKSGLTHPSEAVRESCLEAVIAIVEDTPGAATPFVAGLAGNLGTPDTHGALAAAALVRVVELDPGAAGSIHDELAAGLSNRTPLDNTAIPFVVRGSTVSAVTVDIAAQVVEVDPTPGDVLIDPLVQAVRVADTGTIERALGIFARLSRDHPDEATAAVAVAADALEERNLRTRRRALEVLANVAAYHPDRVGPVVDQLLIATDDDSPQVRSGALIALTNVCSAVPEAIGDGIHRVIGRLDDDSAMVRTRAGELIVAIADRDPELVEPAAETADRLRRLQRDPAVDADPARLQNASTAIQTGVPATELEASESAGDGEEIWSPETADEMGASGDTKVFEPVGDEFDLDFDEALGEEEAADKPSDEVDARSTDIDDGPPDQEVDELSTVIDADGDAPAASGRADADVDELSTVIEPDAGDAEDPGDGDERSTDGDDEPVDELSTVIERSADADDEAQSDDEDDDE